MSTIINLFARMTAISMLAVFQVFISKCYYSLFSLFFISRSLSKKFKKWQKIVLFSLCRLFYSLFLSRHVAVCVLFWRSSHLYGGIFLGIGKGSFSVLRRRLCLEPFPNDMCYILFPSSFYGLPSHHFHEF